MSNFEKYAYTGTSEDLRYTPLKNSSDFLFGTLGVGESVGANVQLQSTATSATQVALMLQGANSQSADFLEIQNNLGSPLTRIDSNGNLWLPADPTQPLQACTKEYVDNKIAAAATGVSSFNTRTGNITLSASDVTTALTYTPLKNTTDTMSGGLTVSSTLGVGGAVWANTQLQSTVTSASNVGLVIKGAASQSADLFDLENSSSIVLSKFDSSGMLTLAADPTAALGAATKEYVDNALTGKQSSGSYITALSGDVSATGPNTAAATVNTVGGLSAASVAAGATAANAATSANVASTIFKRDASGNFTAGTITATNFSGAFAGNGSGLTSLNASNLSSGTVPLGVLSQATTSTSGYLSSTDWNTFNSGVTSVNSISSTATSANVASTIIKRDASGNFTAGTITANNFSGAFAGNGSGLTSLNATNLSSGTVPLGVLSQASTSTSGYLSSTDWNTFNSGVASVNSISSTATSANVASTIVKRDPSGNFTAGTITATNFSGAFAGNGSGITSLNASNLASGTVPLGVLPQATTSTSGYLSSTDWNTFNTMLPSTTGTMTGNLTVNGQLTANIPYANLLISSSYAFSTRNTWVTPTGATVTVPQNGTYYICYSGRLFGTSSGEWWKVRLYNQTTSTQLSVALGHWANSDDGDATATRCLTSGTLNASNVLTLQYYISGSGSGTVSVNGNGDGDTGISMFRVSN
jgi:hypothetical protein